MSAAVSIADPDQLAIATIRTPCIDAAQHASPFGWELYVGSNGAIVGMDTVGASAPLKELQTKFGFTPEAIVGIARERLAGANAG